MSLNANGHSFVQMEKQRAHCYEIRSPCEQTCDPVRGVDGLPD